jgi:uncharacterized membrane protein YgaE (UPF0421/DUF939 family)
MPEEMRAATPSAPEDTDKLGVQQGLRTALAAGLSFWLTQLLHLPAGYWAAISAIVVMQSEVGATVVASRDRLAGSAMGAFVGWLTAMVWRHNLVAFSLAVFLVMVLCSLLRYKNAGRLGGVTVAIIVLIPHAGAVWRVAVERFLEVAFGICISLAVALAWPKYRNS